MCCNYCILTLFLFRLSQGIRKSGVERRLETVFSGAIPDANVNQVLVLE